MRPKSKWIALAVLPLLALVGLTIPWLPRPRDSFRGDTINGRLSLAVVAIARGDAKQMVRTVMGTYGTQTVGYRILTGRLPVEAQLTISVSLPAQGFYRQGGGWIFRGKSYYGRYPVWSQITEATTSDPRVLAVTVIDQTGLAHGQLRLQALAPGQAALRIRATPAGGPPGSASPIEDEFAFDIYAPGVTGAMPRGPLGDEPWSLGAP